MGRVVTEVHQAVKISRLPNVARVCWDPSVNHQCEELCVDGGSGALPALLEHCPVVWHIQVASEGCER